MAVTSIVPSPVGKPPRLPVHSNTRRRRECRVKDRTRSLVSVALSLAAIGARPTPRVPRRRRGAAAGAGAALGPPARDGVRHPHAPGRDAVDPGRLTAESRPGLGQLGPDGEPGRRGPCTPSASAPGAVPWSGSGACRGIKNITRKATATSSSFSSFLGATSRERSAGGVCPSIPECRSWCARCPRSATDSLGTVAAGKQTDLVLLDDNPLADSTNVLKVRAVVADGRYFDRSTLDRLLAEALASAKKNP